MKREKPKAVFEFEGLKLTQEAVNMLKSSQDFNNAGVNNCANTIVDIMCFIVSGWTIDDSDEEHRNIALSLLVDLGTLRIMLKKLEGPVM